MLVVSSSFFFSSPLSNSISLSLTSCLQWFNQMLEELMSRCYRCLVSPLQTSLGAPALCRSLQPEASEAFVNRGKTSILDLYVPPPPEAPYTPL